MLKKLMFIFSIILFSMGLQSLIFTTAEAARMDKKSAEVNLPTETKVNQEGGASTESQVVVKDKIPEGTIINQNQATLKEGFVFEQVSKSKVNVIAHMKGGVTGSFDCTCNETNGGCDAVITGSSVSCAKSTCSASCYMIVTIPAPTQIQM